MTSDIDDMGAIESGGLTEELIDQYNGTRTTIAEVKLIDGTTAWGEDGKPLPEGQQRPIKQLQVSTASIGTDKAGNPIVIREKFNLKKDKVTGKLGWSMHEKSKSFKFLQNLKLNHFKDVIGKPVIVVKKVWANGKPYLGINY